MRAVVEQGLGLSWQIDSDPYGLGLDALAGLALRENPKRAQLVVSTVLGKHLPVAPDQAVQAGRQLAALIRAKAPLVLGYCETATGLGHVVAEALSVPGAAAHYVHTTRRPDPSVPAVTGFDEEHSHAVAHTLQLRDPSVLLDGDRPVVLVDDELTTGTTALNTVAALQALGPRTSYIVATLLDLRTPGARAAFQARAADLGVDVEVVALLSGSLALPADAERRAAELRTALAELPPAPPAGGSGTTTTLAGAWPAKVPTGGRTGVDTGDLLEPAAALAGRVAGHLSGGPVLVLGTEELMWLPLQLAAGLPGEVVFQSTTRSPVLAADLPGYAVRRALLFPAPDEPGRTSRLHGLPDTPYADVVVVVDTPAADAGPLAQALRPWASEQVLVVEL